MNGRHVTFGRQARSFLAVELLDVVIAVVQRGGEMSSGAAGLTSTDLSIVDQHDGTASTCEKIGRRHSRDSRSNDADVRAQILGKRLELRDFGCAHPDGGRVT